LKWSIFCTVTERPARAADFDPHLYFEVGDRDDLSYQEKLAEYRTLADNYFDVGRYTEFCSTALKHVDELMLDWISSTEFDALLVETVRETYPAHEQEEFLAHFRGLLGLWAQERGRSLQTV
jgi:hypothetical protein